MGTGMLRRYHQARAAKAVEEVKPVINPASVVATAQILNEFKAKPQGSKPRLPSLSKEPKPQE